MRREQTVEGVIRKGQRERVSEDVLGLRGLAPRLGEHRRALVEADDLARQMASEETGPARNVERPSARERVKCGLERRDLLVPARALALGEPAGAQVPVVVLTGTALVVGLHAS